MEKKFIVMLVQKSDSPCPIFRETSRLCLFDCIICIITFVSLSLLLCCSHVYNTTQSRIQHDNLQIWNYFWWCFTVFWCLYCVQVGPTKAHHLFWSVMLPRLM